MEGPLEKPLPSLFIYISFDFEGALTQRYASRYPGSHFLTSCGIEVFIFFKYGEIVHPVQELSLKATHGTGILLETE